MVHIKEDKHMYKLEAVTLVNAATMQCSLVHRGITWSNAIFVLPGVKAWLQRGHEVWAGAQGGLRR
jgi:hypothetical protein